MNEADCVNFLSSVSPFSGLTEEENRVLVVSSERRSVSTKQILFIEGEVAQSGWIVIDGRVAMVKSSPNGRELIMELLPPGELFGVVAFIDTRPYPLTARAQIDGLVLRIPRRVMLPLLKTHSSLAGGFMEVVTGRMRGTQNLARSLAHDKVETRICSILLAMVPRLILRDSPKSVEIQVGRQELADTAGTTIESASRVVKALERDGLVDASKVGLLTIINLDRIAEIAAQGAG